MAKGHLKFIDRAGLKFGKLTIIELDRREEPGIYFWRCKCDCDGPNSEIIVPYGNLSCGNTKSCGCSRHKSIIREDGRKCTRCDVFQPWSEYKPRPERGKTPYASRCLECQREIGRGYRYTERGSAVRLEYEKTDHCRQYRRQYDKTHPEVRLAASRRHEAKPERKQYKRQYCKENLPVFAFRTAKRRAIKFKATPGWLTSEQKAEMARIYEDCPDGYEVDHIVPLNSPIVCGLHVPWNLQFLKISENRSKSNKLIGVNS